MGLFDMMINNMKKNASEDPLSVLNPMIFLGVCALDTKKDYDVYCRERDEALMRKGFQNGYHQGNVDAAEKFATLLEQSDNMRIGSFALGCHVARLGGNSDEKLGVIVDALGEPNSFALSKYVRSENDKIIRENLSFEKICDSYLDSLDAEQLKSVDSFLRDVINADSISSAERNFYQNEWAAYLNRRIK